MNKCIKCLLAGYTGIMIGLLPADDAAARGRGGGHLRPHIHGGGFRVYPSLSWSFGYGYGPFWSPYYPPRVYVPVQPPIYIEQAPVAPAAPAAENYWYYCSNPQGYYPYVQQCSVDWQLIPPTPN